MKRIIFKGFVIILLFHVVLVYDACKKEDPADPIATPPVANFSANPTSGTAPLTINFTCQSTNNPSEWEWDFGDGTGSDKQNPSHTYYNNDSYTVTLEVTNSGGYSTEIKQSFIDVTGGEVDFYTDPRDMKVYKTVTIGDRGQIWFGENLNYKIGSSWCFDNNPANCTERGRLYHWRTAKIACPAGWHLPSDEEWKTLEMHLGMSQSDADTVDFRGTDEGKKLKSTYGWFDNGNGIDLVGFNALPAGWCRDCPAGQFYVWDGNAIFWTSTKSSNIASSYFRSLQYLTDQIARVDATWDIGLSVRCVKD